MLINRGLVNGDDSYDDVDDAKLNRNDTNLSHIFELTCHST